MKAIRSLLVAYDGSDQAKAALDIAIGLARNERASVVACYVMDVATEIGRVAAGFRYAPASARKTLCQDAAAILAEASSHATAAGFQIETKFVDAPTIAGIEALARRARADMIVIGSHGRSGLPRIVLGSVAEGVMRHANVPVLIVRTPTRVSRKRTVATGSRDRRKTG